MRRRAPAPGPAPLCGSDGDATVPREELTEPAMNPPPARLRDATGKALQMPRSLCPPWLEPPASRGSGGCRANMPAPVRAPTQPGQTRIIDRQISHQKKPVELPPQMEVVLLLVYVGKWEWKGEEMLT